VQTLSERSKYLKTKSGFGLSSFELDRAMSAELNSVKSPWVVVSWGLVDVEVPVVRSTLYA
jgi:hypothetical protein